MAARAGLAKRRQRSARPLAAAKLRHGHAGAPLSKSDSLLATIRHHSIKRARHIECPDDLTAAKRVATREFGNAFVDHVIEIYDSERWGSDGTIATRRIGDARWTDARRA